MLKSITNLLVLTSLFLSALVTSELNLTRKLYFETYDPKALQIGSQIFIVSKYDSIIRIDSSDDNYEPCRINTDEVEESIDQEKYEAVALGSRNIIVWGVHKSFHEQNKTGGYRNVRYVILIIDTHTCHYKSLGNINETIPDDNHEPLPPKIIPNRDDTFDVFLNVKPGWLPRRFYKDGWETGFDHQMQNKSEHLSIQKLDVTDKYAVVDYDEKVLKILDHEFKELKSIEMKEKQFFKDFSVGSSPTSWQIGIISNFGSGDATLSLFESSLERSLTKLLYKDDPAKDYRPFYYLLIDSNGRSFTTYKIYEMDGLHSIHRHGMSIVSSDGQVLFENDIDVFDSECENCWLYQPAFLLDNREYCTVNHYIPPGGYGFTKIKCFDVSKI